MIHPNGEGTTFLLEGFAQSTTCQDLSIVWKWTQLCKIMEYKKFGAKKKLGKEVDSSSLN